MIEIIKEIIGRLSVIVITFIIFRFDWRLSLIAPPLLFKIYNITFCFRDRIYQRIWKLILDLITHLFHFGYLVYAIILCNQNIDGWYSWVIGIITWLILCQLLGFLWPRRWHYEKVEGHL